MSIEKSFESIATSLASIAESLKDLKSKQQEATDVIIKKVSEVNTIHPPVAAPAPVVPAPVVAAPVVPTPAPAVVEAPVTPTAVVQSGSAPFTDAKGLMAYVMKRYQELGPIKGASIQNVLTELGHKNINELKVEQYGEFFTKVEAL